MVISESQSYHWFNDKNVSQVRVADKEIKIEDARVIKCGFTLWSENCEFENILKEINCEWR